MFWKIVALLLACTAPWASGNDRWKLVAGESSVTYGQVVVTGERDAWAFGWDVVGIGAWIPMADGPHRPTAFHWNGERWTKSAFPVERGGVGPVAASGPSDVWALAGDAVQHWDGRAWTTALKLPGMTTSLAVVSDRDVWVFGDRRAWHYDGATWAERRVPFTAFQVSARSATDIWAIGTSGVHHFDGRTWTGIDLPQTPEDSQLTAVTADASGVWITGDAGMSSFLLSQTGSGWRVEDTSATAGRMTRSIPPVPDGRGGHWFMGSTDENGYDSALAHRDASGRWTKVPAGGELTSLSTVPGGPLLATGAIGRASGVFRGLP
ncbi:hypothetical protein ACIBG8_52895 [Nonomuraea sp. NPDC050556]|uniref:hypothetical protein n=1 Tax=Nonomuraea sp. NPDC050556 TaxID=3364369 RepID=UPI0037876258